MLPCIKILIIISPSLQYRFTMHFSRRHFIRDVTLAAAGMSVEPLLAWPGRPIAPSDQLNLGLIGCRGRGFSVLKTHLELGDINCLGLCDVDENILREKAADLEKNTGRKPKLYRDYRRMLEEKDIDAVIIATPDHWHCLQTVHACQAGKDVFVEKPLANSIEECDLMVKATRRYQRIVQVGQQQRSAQVWNELMPFIHSGRLGKLRKVNLWANFNYGVGALKQADEPIPAGVDFDLWLGPAPVRSFNPTRFHSSWRHFWDYGGGLMTDWGVHLIDMALWAGDILAPPSEIMAYGGNLSFKEHSRETYDTMTVVYPMDAYVITWQHSAGLQNGPYNMLYGAEFVGDEGTIVADRGKWRFFPEHRSGREPALESFEKKNEYNDTLLHARDFVNCVKSREEPVCPIELGRMTALYAHAANIAVRSGAGRLVWDETGRRFVNHQAANEYLRPAYREPWILPDL
jgi:predicted dehydrogenase